MHNDPELFALVGKALDAVDPVVSEKNFNAAFRRLREEAFQIPIGYINIPWAAGPRIAKWEPYPVSQYFSAHHTITLK
jgi:ABC-type transport system substrate-binding protein